VPTRRRRRPPRRASRAQCRARCAMWRPRARSSLCRTGRGAPRRSTFGVLRCIWNTANHEAWAVGVHLDESYVEDLFRARYLEMVRLAGLLGAGDPEDIAQEAFTRLMNKEPDLGDARAWRVCAASSARACSSSSRSVRPSSAEAISAAPSFRALGLDAGAQAPSGAQVSLAGTGRAAIRALRDQAVLASCSFQTPGSWTVPRLVVTVAGSGNVSGQAEAADALHHGSRQGFPPGPGPPAPGRRVRLRRLVPRDAKPAAAI
jgi:hypothetical protein